MGDLLAEMTAKFKEAQNKVDELEMEKRQEQERQKDKERERKEKKDLEKEKQEEEEQEKADKEKEEEDKAIKKEVKEEVPEDLEERWEFFTIRSRNPDKTKEREEALEELKFMTEISRVTEEMRSLTVASERRGMESEASDDERERDEEKFVMD